MKELKKENRELKERLNSSQKTIDEAEKILENNKLIAAFMGVKESDELYKGHPTFVGDHLRKAGLPFNSIMGNCIDNPPFHSSWDWLIPVVEKIQKEHTTITIDFLSFNKYSQDNSVMVTVKSIDCNVTSKNSLQATYLAVVEFIKWYNKNK